MRRRPAAPPPLSSCLSPRLWAMYATEKYSGCMAGQPLPVGIAAQGPMMTEGCTPTPIQVMTWPPRNSMARPAPAR